jgi:hypothetical protein
VEYIVRTIILMNRIIKIQNGGGGGIRTHETLARLPVFKTGAFNRSATPPWWLASIRGRS